MPSLQFFILATIALLFILIGLQLFTLRKMIRVDKAVWPIPSRIKNLEDQIKQKDINNFRQLESLLALYWDLKPMKSLPPTRGWAGSPDFLREISSHILQKKPKVIVECSSGVSTIVMAYCLKIIGHGHVYSLEHDTNYAEITKNRLNQNGLNDWVTIIIAPLVETTTDIGTQPWYNLSDFRIGNIDMLVIDGPPHGIGHLARYPAGAKLFDKIATNGVIFIDDADRNDEKLIVEKWVKQFKFNKAINPRCEKGLAILCKQ